MKILTNAEKLKTFEKHINMITQGSVREFVEFVLLSVPEYFWNIPASPTGRFHSGQTLVEHVQGCLTLSEKVIAQFKGHWTDRQNDQLLVALMLHDCWKCDVPEKAQLFTKEYVQEKGYSEDIIGKLKSSRFHPEVAFQEVLSLSIKFNILARKNNTKQISGKNLQPILNGIRHHYGPWTKTKLKKPFCLSWPFDTVVMQVHNVDFMTSQTAYLMVRGSHD